MNKNILYLTDSHIYFYNHKVNKVFKSSVPKKVIIRGKIANIPRFITVFEKFLKTNHLGNSILGDKIKIIVHPKYTPADITMLKSIFEKLNYRKILIEDETKYYPLNEKSAWISLYHHFFLVTYLDMYKRKITLFIEEDFFLEKEELYQYVKNRVGDKEIYLLGNMNLVENFYRDFENLHGNKTYMFTDSEIHLLKEILKEKSKL